MSPIFSIATEIRKADYDFAQFAAEWERFYQAIRVRVPKAAFAGPDTAYNTEWLVPFAKKFQHEAAFLSQHYYAEGPPTDPSMTIDRLLHPNRNLQAEFEGMQQVMHDFGLPFRLAETNSCYQGGKPGVSDTFASALWGADLMYQLASAGGMGINFHGGGYGWYTPIAGTRENGFIARPIFYGMLLFAQAGAGQLFETQLEHSEDAPLLPTYALRANSGTIKVAAINKNLRSRRPPRDRPRPTRTTRHPTASNRAAPRRHYGHNSWRRARRRKRRMVAHSAGIRAARKRSRRHRSPRRKRSSDHARKRINAYWPEAASAR